jgi:hypothetical protein
MSANGVTVTAWDPAARIVTLDIYGQKTQADVDPSVVTQSDWMAFLATVAQPVVDSLIKQNTFDPNTLVQAATDITQQVLTPAELSSLAAIFPPPKGS